LKGISVDGSAVHLISRLISSKTLGILLMLIERPAMSAKVFLSLCILQIKEDSRFFVFSVQFIRTVMTYCFEVTPSTIFHYKPGLIPNPEYRRVLNFL
jgi:hypothetical protein